MRFRLFIFDFDGTLADSGPWMIEAFNKAAQRFGLRQFDRDEIEALRERDNRTIMREVGVRWWQLPQLAAYVRRLADEAEPPPLFEGVAPMLRALHASGATLAIVSSNTESTIRRALGPEYATLIHAFACNAAMFGKAAKFRQVLRQTGVSAAEAIAIGDETRDIEAARKARIACGAVRWGYASAGILAANSPDFMFETPADIIALR
ncbi:HAD hydrolase-like protein [Vitreimonas sp.]|uniref:HAD hydrolase-like protein n=1 Tax=Vitreimonas sp. TaxID=3069702 RepID=UPI002ED821F3